MRSNIVKIWLLLGLILLASCGKDLPDNAKNWTAGKYLCVSATDLSFDELSSTQTLRIVSNTRWRISCNDNWISLSQESGTGDAVISVTAMTNEITSSRQSYIVFTSDDNKNKESIRIVQNAAKKYLTLDVSNIVFSGDGGTESITVKCNSLWTASCDVDWISLSSRSGSGDANITVKAIANPNTTTRQTTITFSDSETILKVSVGQKGISPVLTIKVGNVSFNMIRVDGGTFWMGATSEQGYDYDSDERPIHSVTLSGYYIGETEVTEALWNTVLGISSNNNPKNPKTDITWHEASWFVEQLSAKTGMKFRLLTEAEWEFAARGGTKTKNYKYAGSNNISNVAWYEDNSGGQVHEVATKAPNELGLYDMSGNVWEWCQDYYGSYSSGSVTDPTGPPSGITTRRVLRGGSWLYDYTGSRVSDRLYAHPNSEFSDIGFRLGL